MSGRWSTAGSELTVGQLAEQAAEAVRALNHLTWPDAGALDDPGQLSDIVAALACTTARLPQLLAQLSSWLVGEQRAGRLRVDACSDTPAAATVTAATTALTRAASGAVRASHDLDAAHQHLAHLAATGEDERLVP